MTEPTQIIEVALTRVTERTQQAQLMGHCKMWQAQGVTVIGGFPVEFTSMLPVSPTTKCKIILEHE